MQQRNTNSKVSAAAIGHYTKGAVENFEEGIVNETNYLEKAKNNLENINEEKNS